MNKRVLVAMSGGVDSSVTAALLQKQGMEVEGVTLKLTSGLCCDIGSAQAVCRQLGIPHRMIDAQTEFSHGIVQNFISEYQHGRTPNPCIRCNELIKFQLLLQYALANGFRFLATGHYARIEQNPSSHMFFLKKGVDNSKDQSYFLYRVTQKQLAHVLLPLGALRKPEVRALAREMRLPVAERPESQEICFVPDNDYRSFLKEHAPEICEPGELVLTDGTVVGTHEGIAFFTIGQRRGLKYAAGERRYVIRIEPETKRVVLGRSFELLTSELRVSDPHFIPFGELAAPLQAVVKIRYRSPFAAATLEPVGPARIRVVFEQPVTGVCPGQAAVFYDGDTVLGGGIIER